MATGHTMLIMEIASSLEQVLFQSWLKTISFFTDLSMGIMQKSPSICLRCLISLQEVCAFVARIFITLAFAHEASLRYLARGHFAQLWLVYITCPMTQIFPWLDGHFIQIKGDKDHQDCCQTAGRGWQGSIMRIGSTWGLIEIHSVV